MSAAKKFAGLYLAALLLTHRLETMIAVALLFLFSAWLLTRASGRVRRLWRAGVANRLPRTPTHATILSNLKREVAYGRRHAMTAVVGRSHPTDAELEKMDDIPEQCPRCGSWDTEPHGNTSYRCGNCGVIFP
jgi:ribosomal protein S27AE